MTSQTTMPRNLFRTLPILLAGLCLVQRPASADSIVTTDGFLPAVHITGATGRFRTDVSVFNPEPSTTATVQFYFTPADTDGSGLSGLEIQGGLPARTSATFPDMVLSNFGYGSASGMLEVRSSVPVIVTSNTYNIDGPNGGTYGQFSPAQPFRNALGYDNSINGDLYLTGLPNDSNHRVNAVVMNPSDVTLETGVQLVDKFGNVYGTRIYTVPPFSQTQLNDVFGSVFASAGPPSDNSYRLTVFVNAPGNAYVLCYATVTDRRTGDPYLITGQKYRP